MLTRLALFLSTSMSLLGCGPAQEPAAGTPSPPPAPKPWKGEHLAGPFEGVAGFCGSLGVATCEERDDAVIALPGVREAKKGRDGSVVSLLTVTSGDGKLRRVHLLLRRNAEVFALPAVAEYDLSDGKRHEITARSLDLHERSELVVLAFSHETTSGEAGAKQRETRARQAHCRVDRDFPVACALFDTEVLVSAGDELREVPEQTAEVLVIPRERGAVTLTAHGQSAPEPLKLLSAPGEYQITFP